MQKNTLTGAPSGSVKDYFPTTPRHRLQFPIKHTMSSCRKSSRRYGNSRSEAAVEPVREGHHRTYPERHLLLGI